MDALFYLVPLFFFAALCYSMVGFGGGSTYLALLVLFSVPYAMVPKVALVCNLIVVSGGCYFFFKEGSLQKGPPALSEALHPSDEYSPLSRQAPKPEWYPLLFDPFPE